MRQRISNDSKTLSRFNTFSSDTNGSGPKHTGGVVEHCQNDSPNGTVVSPPLLPPAPSLNNTFGAALLGALIGLMLYGLTAHQTYRYFNMYRSDIKLLKALVIALFLADTLYSVLCIHICYHYLVTNYFQPLALLNGVWSIRLLTPVTTFIIVLSQIFYARRVYLISPRNIFIVVPAGLFLSCGTGFAIAAAVEAFKNKSFADWDHFAWLTSVAFAFVLPTDLLLTGTLIAYLMRSRTGFRQTDSKLNVLIIYTINTGLLTSTLGFMCLIMAFVFPDNLIYVAFNILTTRSYVNAVMAVLNSRQSLIGSRRTTDELGTFGMDTVLQQHKQPTPAMLNALRPSPGRVVIDIAAARSPESSSSRNMATTASTRDGDESFQENTFEMTDIGVEDKSAEIC